WIQELAFLGPAEVLDAHHVLEKQLFRARVLPDSEALRSEIRAAISRWVERVEASGIVESDGLTPTVVRLPSPLSGLCAQRRLGSNRGVSVSRVPRSNRRGPRGLHPVTSRRAGPRAVSGLFQISFSGFCYARPQTSTRAR